MNILTSTLPIKIKLGDNLYDINYDYRTIINILLAFEDNQLTNYEKIIIMIKNIYKNDIPNELYEEAVKKAIKFIDLGKEYTERSNHIERIYSFSQDASYIFSGINSTHNIDLEKESDMHWWKFMSFFMDMGSECTFGELIYYRKRNLEGKLTKEEKEQYNKIKNIVELKNEETYEQEELRKEFFRKFHEN